MHADCLFCKIVAGAVPAKKLFEDELVTAIEDTSPQAPTHILVMPREHIGSAAELRETDGRLLGAMFGALADLADREGLPSHGYRIVTNIGKWGGQSVDHLHFHLMGGRKFSWPPG